MKASSKKRSISNRKNKILLYSKIMNTLSSFVKTGHSTQDNFYKTSFNTGDNFSFFHKSFTKNNSTSYNYFPKNNSSSHNYSKTEVNNSSHNIKPYRIEQENKITNPLYLLYKNKFYPHSYKNKNYIREVYQCLPPLKLVSNNEDSNCYNITTNLNEQNNKNNNLYDKKINEILWTEYKNSVNNFNNIYKNNGEELLYDLGKSKEFSNESIIDAILKNEININESNYISSVLKDKKKKKNYSVKLKNENFTSPKNSLLTLKINNELITNLKEIGTSYTYNTYVEQINENQKNKLQLLIMPKMKIKVMKYAFELHKNQKNLENTKTQGEGKSKKILTINKHLFHKINKKMDNEAVDLNNKDVKKEKDNQNINQENLDTNQQNPNEKLTINSTIMRNLLIVEVNRYYCKYLFHSSVNPCSRMGATFINCYNKLFLFGGLLTSEQSDLWNFEIKDKAYTWKRIKYNKDFNLNPRYGHSCVLFNNSLYIFGGNMNIKKLKYPLEDILIYNIKTNTMKIGTFKTEKYNFSGNNLYIPQRRNHIAQAIGWNMIVHGGIDINREYLKENIVNVNEEEIRVNYTDIKKMDVKGDVLGDFMAVDLISLKWMHLSNIIYKIKGKKVSKNVKNGIPRVYHSSCLVLSYENLLKGNKLNIYKNNSNIKAESLENEIIEEKQKFEIKFEGIYIFGGLDEGLKDTNNLFILHCFRNPLVFFEPIIHGAPPSPRHMAVMNFNKILNFITIYGGKDSYRIFNDFYILDIMNFQWIQIDLFGPHSINGRMGHCGGIINEKLYIFGGCDENNKYPNARVLCIELDLLRNKKLTKIFDFAKNTLSQNPKDKTARNVMQLLKEGAEIPHDIYPFLQLDDK